MSETRFMGSLREAQAEDPVWHEHGLSYLVASIELDPNTSSARMPLHASLGQAFTLFQKSCFHCVVLSVVRVVASLSLYALFD